MTKLLVLTCATGVLLAMCIGSVDASNPVTYDICGTLEGFQFETLELPEYWSLTVQEKILCFIPKGYEVTNVTTCTIYFSICKVLPPSKCGGRTNSSTCQKVHTNDGQTHYFSTGDYRGVDRFFTIDDPHLVGFVTLRQGDSINTLLCNGAADTLITWICDETKVWDPSSLDVTQYVKSDTSVSTGCLLNIQLYYSGACYTTPTLAPDTCVISPYDVTGLIKHDYWFANLPVDACYNEGDVACTMFFSFCQALPNAIDSRCYGAAVCLVGMEMDGTSNAYSLGKFTNSAHFVINTESGGFHMEAENGSSCTDSKFGLNTRIYLECNSTTKWNDYQDLSNIIHVSYLPALDDCSYSIILPYSGACIPVGPTTTKAIINHGSSTRPTITDESTTREAVHSDQSEIVGLSVIFSFSALSSIVLLVIFVIMARLLCRRCQEVSYQKLHKIDDQPMKS